MPKAESAGPALVRRRVLAWYGRHRRELEWRTTTDPYAIIVSEVMLQQTQVRRVQAKLPEFLRRYPTLARLARAGNADVIRAWRGMGYNNRAIRLRDMARTIIAEHGGRIPRDVETLMSLPGVGRYTAHAVLCFAYRRRVPVVDVNIRRVLGRVFTPQRTLDGTIGERDAWELAAAIMPRDCFDWTQALMDLGATICTARKPACARCPVAAQCASAHALSSARPAARPPRSDEPRHAGVPQRIWRGKAVEALRSLDGASSITIEELGAIVKPGFHPEERTWLLGIIEKLALDGIVAKRRRGSSVRVRLAS
jgi:A/G-specific adenine glycosylase